MFGSRVREKHHPYSDIDALFEEAPNFSISESELSKIREDLEESKLTIKVDIVNSKNLEQGFIETVANEKVEV